MEQRMAFQDRIIIPLARRQLLLGGALALAAFATRPAIAASVIGKAVGVKGAVHRKPATDSGSLLAGAELNARDTVMTGEDGFADLSLKGETRILLGNRTALTLDDFLASQGGTMELGAGQMVFDRPEGLPKIDLTLRTAFGMIGVRGTKFFAGPNRGVFAVFVEHGAVAIEAGGVTTRLGAGEGTTIARSGDRPTPVVRWGQARIDEAYASVGL